MPHTVLSQLDTQALGHHELQLIKPDLLELKLVTSRSAGQGTALWDFVDAEGNAQLPEPSEWSVTVDGAEVIVVELGFRSRTLYANLHQWDLRVGASLYLQLARPVGVDQIVEVTASDPSLVPDGYQFQMVADAERLSSVIHVSQAGYALGLPKKAILGYYLGSLGELSTAVLQGFELRRVSDGASVFSGVLSSRADYGFNLAELPYQEVLEADFSGFDTPGNYQLFVEGLGLSAPFSIGHGVPALIARTQALGLYHQRSGEAKSYPFTRYTYGAGHTQPAEVPNAQPEYATANFLVQQSTGNAKDNPRHTAPQLASFADSLYPFVRQGTVDVSGGHYDAGDYSKYTTNSADFVHALTFAVDNFPGVAELDNLGIPESGDGVGDVLQELKKETDFLAKMQDADGGFYFLVYPKERRYEDNVLPEQGDQQIVWPKNTLATAAAVAALAEAGSSPAFMDHFPDEAADYLQKAELGWDFLVQAIAEHGYDGSYQQLTHYGTVFFHDDEFAWAAAALFAATGDAEYHEKLIEWFPDPSDRSVRRWTWWRLFGGYGAAVRTYAFAERSGRRTVTELDGSYLATCESEVVAGGRDQAQRALDSAYGTSLAIESKRFNSAGWYFGSSLAFDCAAAYQLDANPDLLEAVLSNLYHELGVNPLNQSFLPGIGTSPQTEVVSQADMNQRRSLPPTGVPVGSLQSGFSWIGLYGTEISAASFPSDSDAQSPYPLYDRWGNAFNTTTEPVISDLARSFAVSSWLMASSSLAEQEWRAAEAYIDGIAADSRYGSVSTATLNAPELDLSEATIVWESSQGDIHYGESFEFHRTQAELAWIEAEAYLPDGRRVFATIELEVTPAPPVLVLGENLQIHQPQSGLRLETDIESSSPSEITWSIVSGPGPLSFSDPHAANTDVYLAAPGLYTLRASVSADGFVTEEEIQIEVLPALKPPALGTTLRADEHTVAHYGFDGNGSDSSGNAYHLQTQGRVDFASDNLAWMQRPGGSVARFREVGDQLTITMPDSEILPSEGGILCIEARLFPRDFLGYGVSNLGVLSLKQNWDTSLELVDRKWETPELPRVQVGNEVVVFDSEWGGQLTSFTWSALTMQIDSHGYCEVYINDHLVKSLQVNMNASRTNDWTLTIGNFDGDIDELRISTVLRAGQPSAEEEEEEDELSNEGLSADASTVALYSFDWGGADQSSHGHDLMLHGGAQFRSDELSWMQEPSGAAIEFSALGQFAQVSIPDDLLATSTGQEITLEGRFYFRNYLAYGSNNAQIFSLSQSWDTSLEVYDQKWNDPGVPFVRSGQERILSAADWQQAIPLNQWVELKLVLHQDGEVHLYVDGLLLATGPSGINHQRFNDWTFTIGNFDGLADDIRISSVARQVE